MTKTDDDDDEGRRPRPVTDETRADVARLHGEGLGRNAIARELGISGASVTKIAQAFDPPLLFDRHATALATQAAQIDMGAERADIARMLLVRARESLEAISAPAVVFSFGGKDNTYAERLLDAPPVADQQRHMTIAAIALQRHTDLVKVDAGRDAEEARGMVGRLRDSLDVLLEQSDAAGLVLPDPTKIDTLDDDGRTVEPSDLGGV